jgi:hypothetical protein
VPYPNGAVSVNVTDNGDAKITELAKHKRVALVHKYIEALGVSVDDLRPADEGSVR